MPRQAPLLLGCLRVPAAGKDHNPSRGVCKAALPPVPAWLVLSTVLALHSASRLAAAFPRLLPPSFSRLLAFAPITEIARWLALFLLTVLAWTALGYGIHRLAHHGAGWNLLARLHRAHHAPGYLSEPRPLRWHHFLFWFDTRAETLDVWITLTLPALLVAALLPAQGAGCAGPGGELLNRDQRHPEGPGSANLQSPRHSAISRSASGRTSASGWCRSAPTPRRWRGSTGPQVIATAGWVCGGSVCHLRDLTSTTRQTPGSVIPSPDRD